MYPVKAEHLNTVSGTFANLCLWNAGSELLVDQNERYTGARLFDEAKRIAQTLYEQNGLSKGDRVAFIGTSSCRFFAAFFAAQLLGCVTCNLHIKESPEFLRSTLDRLNLKAVVCDPEMCDLLRKSLPKGGIPLALISLGDKAETGFTGYHDMMEMEPITELPTDIAPSDPAIIILSSGSTGNPKGILHSQSNFVSWLRASQTLFGSLTRSTRFLLLVGTSFAAWPFSAIPVLYAGGTLVLLSRFSPQGFCEIVEQEKITMAGTVPTIIRMLTPDITDQYDLSSFEMMLCAGEPPSEKDITRILGWADTDIRCLYLASESAPGVSTYWELADQKNHPVCAGKPLPGANLRIINPNGDLDDELPSGEIGEIALTGPTIAMGYLNNPELTQQRFVDGWWRSGDLGWVDGDGFVHIQGRVDNTINTGGIKVLGEEVEICLLKHPQVEQAAVIGVADAKWGRKIQAHVVGNDGINEDMLRQHCAQELACFKCPKDYVFHKNLPLGVTGKLDRVSLRKTYQRSKNPKR